MHLLLTWVEYMHIGMCRRGVYGGSMMCTVVIMWVRVHIWVFWCFSATTDASIDYSTSFHNTTCDFHSNPQNKASHHHFQRRVAA